MTSTANSQSKSLCFPSAEDLEPFLGGGTLLQKAVKAFPLFLLYAAVCGAAVVLRWILAFPKIQISWRNTLWRTITPSHSMRRPNGESIKTIHTPSAHPESIRTTRDTSLSFRMVGA